MKKFQKLSDTEMEIMTIIWGVNKEVTSSELLDIIPRNDSIYVVSKKRQITIEKFSNIIKRNDISKSDIFIKGMIDNSTPDYSSENSLRNTIKERFLKK